MRHIFIIIPLLLLFRNGVSQAPLESWMNTHLEKITWERTYTGVLADYHPVTIVLASDYKQVVGYLMHHGDERKHRLIGDWSKTDRFQLQERDEHDRLAGYLNGSITNDQMQMEWMSADQSRLFSIKAFPKQLIRIKNFKPVAEIIEIAGSPKIYLAVQKMDYGIVSGIARRSGQYSRFEGYCLDGTCSIWNTVIQNPFGAPIRIQMKQKDDKTYKASLNSQEYTAIIYSTTPLTVRQHDNSMGFLDLVYPGFKSSAYTSWLSRWIDPLWADGVAHLSQINQQNQAGRLVHRSSGWIEILDENDQMASGLITFINPGGTRRESFLWLKKDDTFLTQEEFMLSSGELARASSLVPAPLSGQDDPEYMDWLKNTGYTFLLPTTSGVLMATEFNMVFGDDLRLIPLNKGRELIKKKYWKYLGW